MSSDEPYNYSYPEEEPVVNVSEAPAKLISEHAESDHNFEES